MSTCSTLYDSEPEFECTQGCIAKYGECHYTGDWREDDNTVHGGPDTGCHCCGDSGITEFPHPSCGHISCSTCLAEACESEMCICETCGEYHKECVCVEECER